MELAWIKTFVTVANTGNFKRAADVLFVSQPTVTVHIKLLEKELSVSLFDRTSRKVKLTEEGRKYLVHAHKLLSTYQEGLEDLSRFTQGYRDKLTLAISPLIADTIMPYVLKSYLKENPHVEISVNIMESANIEAAVWNENVDVGLSCLNSYETSLNSKLLYEDHVVFVVPHDGLELESAPPFEVETILHNHYILTHNHPGYWNTLYNQLKLKYPKIKTMKVSQVHITKRFIVNGLGVSFLPKSTVRREVLEGRLLEVDCPSIELPEANTYSITKYNHSLEKNFLQFVSKHRFS